MFKIQLIRKAMGGNTTEENKHEKKITW